MLRPSPIAIPDESDEVARLRRMTDDDRAADLAVLTRAAGRLLAINENRERVLTLREPLPLASEELLARLRTRHRSRR